MKNPRKTSAERKFDVIDKYSWHTLSCNTSGALTACLVMHLLLKLCKVARANIVVMGLDSVDDEIDRLEGTEVKSVQVKYQKIRCLT